MEVTIQKIFYNGYERWSKRQAKEFCFLNEIKQFPKKGMIRYVKRFCLLLLIFVIILSGCSNMVSNMIYDYRDAQSNHIIIFPHDYRLFYSDENINFVSKKQDNSPVVIEARITHIGWNEDYIMYKRDEPGNESQWGIFSMKDGTNLTYASETEFSNGLRELNIDSIQLRNVKDILDENNEIED